MRSEQEFEETYNGTKINQLLAQCATGVPMTSSWLATQNVSPQLVQRYKLNKWLQPLGRGAWIRAGTKLTLIGALYAIQQQLEINAYPAARSALEYQGRSHYIPRGENPILQLSLEAGQKLPAWFTNQSFASNLIIINSSLLFDPVYTSLSDWQSGELMINLSSPERAMLEYCYLLPKNADFEEARQLMEGLTTLRPQLLQSTLQACKSVKAKRLFLALASSVAHSWYDELNTETIDLGSGNRSVITNGYLHPEFKITIPKEWISS